MPTLYDGDLNKNMDFTHAGPNGEPASGKAVQKYIKDIDKKKISVGGQFQDKYYFFNSQEEMDEYAADPSKDYLIMSEIQLEEQYRLRIQLENDYYPVFLGQTGNYIRYTFSTVDRDDQVIREPIDVQYVITCGNSKQTVNATYQAGAQVAFNVDEYLREGSNEVSITAKGQTTKAMASRNVTFDVVDLQISDNFDITQQYQNGDNLVVSFSLKGNGAKTVEFYIDGEVQPIDSHTDIYNGTPVQGSKNIYLAGLGSGRHNLQYRAFITMGNGTKFYSDVLYRDFVIVDQQLGENIVILTKFTSPSTNGIIDAFTQPIPLYGAVQYEDFPVDYCIYTAQTLAEYGFTITFGSEVSEYTIQKGRTYEYLVKSMTSTTTPLVFSCQESSLTYNAFIEQSTYDLDIIPGAVMDFNGSDRTNSSNNRDKWADGRNTGTLTGFNWTENSGWNGNRLIVPAGAQFNTNYAPFSSNTLTTTGFTFEIEFSTSRVQNEDTPIIDLTTPVGGVNRGLLITASEIIFSSRGGVTVNTKYKPEENMRVSIVVNPLSSATYERLLFIYVDGILTGAIEYARSDSFMSSKLLSVVGTEDATISIKQIKTYNRPLSADEILNNYILYRDTVSELVDAYDRNDIYIDGTNVVSKDKLAMRTPIIVITCNDDTDDTPDRIAMMNSWDKNNKGTYVKMYKMEVINLADPTKNLTLRDFSMRCQGTSSMAYPRKNFRFYLQADGKDTTVAPYQTHVYDYQGNEIGDTGANKKKRLYSFKAGAQPVKTWCLKADYAESSSTHNTGVARLWTDVMKNARIANANIDNRFYLKDLFPNTDTPCKTIAQHCAEKADYQYDVRTTVDGFPISLFYHVHESDPLTFLGKYNWNNDKSTESVYGFCDIPGFDDEFGDTMECWEVVNGDFPCNLFTDISHWEDTDSNGWRHAYEARYPDDHEEQSEIDRGNNGALRRVATWINSTLGASKVDDDPTSATYNKMIVDNAALMERFKTGDPNAEVGEGKNGKWDYLDVYKLAAYYVYLMRFGGVDQTVKNAMFTTEDGKHWFYINYDNDTINGVRNDGALVFDYKIDRQSKDPESPDVYCYAGHESVLWNNLEADDEFMSIVSIIDNALYKAGLSYDNVIDMFNVKQSAKWAERTHNEDYKFKYLDGIDRMQLTKLQGPRKSHRQWWLSHRFTLWDAIDGTDAYIANLIQIKPDGTASPTADDYVTVTPAVDGQIFGFGLEKPEITGVYGQKDVPIKFPMTKDYYIGTTLKYYNAAYFKEIDLSHISKHVNEIDFSKVNTTAFDTSLSSLIMGTMTSQTNTAMQVITGLGNMKYLENLEMVGYTGFNNIDLYENRYLKSLDFRNCTSLTSITLPPAAPLNTIHYPAGIQNINFVDLLSLTDFDIQNNGVNVRTITVNNCANVSICTDPSFLVNWVTNKTTSDNECFVNIDNIDWKHMDPNDLIKIGRFGKRAGEGHLILKGTAEITSNSQTIAQTLIELFGPSVVIPGSEFYVTGPDAVFIIGDSTILEGDEATYVPVIFSQYRDGNMTWSYTGSRTGTTGTVNEDKSYTITTTENGASTGTLALKVEYRTVFGLSTATKSVQIKKRTYPTSSQISIGGESLMNGNSVNVYPVEYSTTGIDGRMVMEWTLTGDITSYVEISSSDNEKCNLIMTSSPSEIVVAGTLGLTVKKYIDNSTIGTYTKSVALQKDTVAISRAVNPYAMTVMYNNMHSRGLCENQNYMLKSEAAQVTYDMLQTGTSYSTSIFYANSDFRNYCTKFPELRYFTSLSGIPSYCFYTCKLQSLELPDSCTAIGNYAFYKCTSLNCTNLLTNNIKLIGDYAFNECTSSVNTSIILSDNVESVGQYAFYKFGYYASGYDYPSSRYANITIRLSENPNFTAINAYSFYGVGGNYLGYRSNYTDRTSNNLIIPDNITTIGNYAFASCPILELKFGENSQLYSIGNAAFAGCTCLAWRHLRFPSSLRTIGSYAFNFRGDDVDSYDSDYDDYNDDVDRSTLDLSDCDNISFGTYCFADAQYIYRLILPHNLSKIPEGMFYNCHLYKSSDLGNRNIIEWPSNLTEIGDYAFGYIDGLDADLYIPEGVTKTGQFAFQYADIHIPASLTNITQPLVLNPISVNAWYVDENNPTYGTLENGKYLIDKDTYTIKEASSSVVSTSSSTSKTVTIPEGITKIDSYAFVRGSISNTDTLCGYITNLILPSSLERINSYAFSLQKIFPKTSILSTDSYPQRAARTYIKNISCEENISIYLDSYALQNAFATSYSSGGTITNISFNYVGTHALDDCEYLSEPVVIDNDCEYIGNSAFTDYGQHFINKTFDVVLPRKLKYLGENAFGGTTSHSYSSDVHGNMVFDDNMDYLTTIGKRPWPSSWRVNNATHHFVVPKNLTNLYMETFRYSGLTWITLPEGWNESMTNTISQTYDTLQSPFDDCNITRLDIHNSIKTITAHHLFDDCIHVSKLEFPEGLERIGNTTGYSMNFGSTFSSIYSDIVIIPLTLTNIYHELEFRYRGDIIVKNATPPYLYYNYNDSYPSLGRPGDAHVYVIDRSLFIGASNWSYYRYYIKNLDPNGEIPTYDGLHLYRMCLYVYSSPKEKSIADYSASIPSTFDQRDVSNWLYYKDLDYWKGVTSWHSSEKPGNTVNGWNIPSVSDWNRILTTDSNVRPGSTVNNQANKHYAYIRITDSLVDNVPMEGLLIFKDNLTIHGVTLNGYDNTTVTELTAAETQTYLEQDCTFLPADGYKDSSNNWHDVCTCGYYWTSDETGNQAKVLQFSASGISYVDMDKTNNLTMANVGEIKYTS